MGRIRIGHDIGFDYGTIIIQLWKNLSPGTQAKFEEVGKQYGYSGMNSLYIFMFIFAIWTVKGFIDFSWERKE